MYVCREDVAVRENERLTNEKMTLQKSIQQPVVLAAALGLSPGSIQKVKVNQSRRSLHTVTGLSVKDIQRRNKRSHFLENAIRTLKPIIRKH